MRTPPPASLQVIASYAESAAVPWANGAGSTVELVSLERSAQLTPGRPRWRLSIAALERPADFSPLPGMHRTFRPVGGNVVLEIDGERHEVAAGAPCIFDGAARTVLVELPHPCHAVNLMVESGPGHAAPEPGVDGTFLLTLEDSDLGPRLTLLREREGAEGDGRLGPVLRF
ncbi:HutD family protein [Brevibacterium salitolerans]|uniref:HutD family protein n=1 Tax=Brevibacterium salitolerans TaxID=1403566 RepID=A0ABN2WME2_9MICO